MIDWIWNLLSLYVFRVQYWLYVYFPYRNKNGCFTMRSSGSLPLVSISLWLRCKIFAASLKTENSHYSSSVVTVGTGFLVIGKLWCLWWHSCFYDSSQFTGSNPMMTSSNGSISRVTGHLCGEFTGPRWIPHTKASDAELWCLLWSALE